MAPEHFLDAPATPKRGGPHHPDAMLNAKIALLCARWPLALEPKVNHSPANNKGTIEEECLFLIKWCHHKNIFDTALQKFYRRADVLYSGWVNKPGAERGLIPRATRQVPRPVNDDERKELLECLIQVFKKEKEAHPDHRPTPRSSTPTTNHFNTESIPFSLAPSLGTEKKRALEEQSSDHPAKKPKGRAESLFSDMLPPRGRSARQDPNPSKGANTSFTTSDASSVFSRPSFSANTSFATSEASTVFSRPSFGALTRSSTQETTPNDDDDDDDHGFELPLLKTQRNTQAFTVVQREKNKSSDYGPSSSFERAFNDSFCDDSGIHDQTDEEVDEQLQVDQQLTQNIYEIDLQDTTVTDPEEFEFRAKLEAIFPSLPSSLRSLSVYVIYEITRVFLHAGVPVKEFNSPVSDALNDYDTLWKKLKSLPCLDGRSFPERCGAVEWAAAFESERRDGECLVLAGSLHFGTDSNSSFRLRLEPLKLDRSHRLGRRLGHDRFFELSIPSLTDKLIPKALTRLGHRANDVFLDWLVDSTHSLIGRIWQPFFCKPKERRASKQDTSKGEGAQPATRFYFFAVEGLHLLASRATPGFEGKHVMSVAKLLDMVRPTKNNVYQPYLKLFSRTSLALSRNHATILLSEDQIRFEKEDIIFDGEVMNDGAGRISRALANEVRKILDLAYMPSAFQGRLGEAKGLWVVDNSPDMTQIWIQVYPSQQKWKRSNSNGVSNDKSHRTLEILKWSGPLKSADLNTQFLPLLVERAINKKTMKDSIAKILEAGLGKEVLELRKAFEHPESLLKWVHEVRPNIKDRLKYGAVLYRAGMPISTEEQIKMLLANGFSPKSLNFLYEQAKSIFQSHCDDLEKRLNITVGKSTYAYMVPDFWGVLEEDEIYIDFSSFTDSISGFSGAMLNGVDVLVARSPAHFASDIQRVRSVARAELMGLKDVIVFPIKGKPSLAAKLSGGDYDGDIAWVCWEESIVNNFVTAEVPDTPDLVKLGILRQDLTKYDEMMEGVKGSSNQTSLFLKKSFAFNMRQSMLGICTSFKEKVCYTQKSSSTREAIYLSKLLSDLVDAPKQGFIFEEEDFRRLKDTYVKIKPVVPKYLSGELYGRTDHILDHLMVVARKTIKSSLNQLWVDFKVPAYWDNDVVLLYEQAKGLAAISKEWKDLLQHLNADLDVVKEKWKRHFNVSQKEKEKLLADFTPFLVECFELFHSIQPHVNGPLTQALLLSSGIGENDQLSMWALLKASAFFASYSKNYVPNAVWWIAGRQLAELKSAAGKHGLRHTIAANMFIALKPDNAMIRRLVSDEHFAEEESESVRNVEELEELDDD